MLTVISGHCITACMPVLSLHNGHVNCALWNIAGWLPCLQQGSLSRCPARLAQCLQSKMAVMSLTWKSLHQCLRWMRLPALLPSVTNLERQNAVAVYVLDHSCLQSLLASGHARSMTKLLRSSAYAVFDLLQANTTGRTAIVWPAAVFILHAMD